jgi:thiol-disulfide isomerase/thioredoxin
MKNITIYIVLAVLCLNFTAHSQDKPNITALKIGDPVLDMTITNIINYPAKTAKISNFKGKLLILDFWATYCTPCLHLLPRYDSLQKQFGNKLQILLITNESSEKAKAQLKRFHSGLPSVTSDENLAKLFPHNSIPHEVWIKDGKIIATGYGEDVNEEAIVRVIQNQPILTDPKEDNLAFDHLAPLLINGNGGRSNIFYQSLITPYIDGLRTVAGYDKNTERVISVAVNVSVISLYHQAFNHLDPLLSFDNRTVIDVPDSLKAKLVRPVNSGFHQWIKQYGFCYDLVLPSNYNGKIYSVMLNDLNRFFELHYGITGHIEKREVTCLVLSRVNNSYSLESKGGEPVFKSDDAHLILKNLPISSFVLLLANQHRKLQTPILDETGYQTPIDLTLNADTGNLEALRKELLKSGLDIAPEKRTIDMLVIRQKVASDSPENPE